MTSSSSPGISLKQEGITYIAGAELPGLIVNVVRGDPDLGRYSRLRATISSSQGGGHGDYHLIVLAPSSVQEMADLRLSFDLALNTGNPVMILSDGAIGQMMGKYISNHRKKDRKRSFPGTTGKPATRERNIITSLDLDAERRRGLT